MIESILNVASWDRFQGLLRPWLAVREVFADVDASAIEGESATEVSRRYSFHHETLDHFFRVELAERFPALEARLADYCLKWRELSRPYAQCYALRFGPTHWLNVGHVSDTVRELSSLDFLEAKSLAGFVFDLAADFDCTAGLLTSDQPQLAHMQLLGEALRCRIHFLNRHPDSIFQTLWNQCWWYDSEESRRFRSPDFAPITSPDARLCDLVEEWRLQRESRAPGFRWLRARRPPAPMLGENSQRLLLGHFAGVTSADWSADGRYIVSGSRDRRVIMWDSFCR